MARGRKVSPATACLICPPIGRSASSYWTEGTLPLFAARSASMVQAADYSGKAVSRSPVTPVSGFRCCFPRNAGSCERPEMLRYPPRPPPQRPPSLAVLECERASRDNKGSDGAPVRLSTHDLHRQAEGSMGPILQEPGTVNALSLATVPDQQQT